MTQCEYPTLIILIYLSILTNIDICVGGMCLESPHTNHRVVVHRSNLYATFELHHRTVVVRRTEERGNLVQRMISNSSVENNLIFSRTQI